MLGGCIEFFDDTTKQKYAEKYIVINNQDGCSSAVGSITESINSVKQTLSLGKEP